MVTMLRLIVLMAAGLGQHAFDKTKLLFNRAFSSGQIVNEQSSEKETKIEMPFVDVPWGTEVRKKLKAISHTDRQEALFFLQKALHSSVEQHLECFEAQRGFSRTILSKNQLIVLLSCMSKTLTSHDLQKAVLLILLAVTTVSQDDVKSITAIDSGQITKYADLFERNKIRLLSDGSIKMGCGKVIAAKLF